MKLEFRDSDSSCVKVAFKEGVFHLQDKDERTVLEYVPVLPFTGDVNPGNYELELLHNEREDYSENCIFQVFVKKNPEDIRIGWIFPIQVLFSREHKDADNQYFLNYAYAATWLLLEHLGENNEPEITTIPQEFYLKDYYDENLTLLVIDREQISQIENFDINTYVVSLYQKGYSWTGKGNLDSVQVDSCDSGRRKIKLIEIPGCLRREEYISNLFRVTIPASHSELEKFHRYYQVIEILINYILKDEFRSYFNGLDIENDNLSEKKDELNNLFKEKGRVIQLFDRYTNLDDIDRKGLDLQCKNFLNAVSRNPKNNVAENLYEVRNVIVHSLYLLSEEAYQVLSALNSAFLDVVMDALLTFHMDT